ncbi:hypothetical protein [Brevibacillus parabrevis]|uniref:hypothetical protein n=1 Tax=Brevibacillus parabrevis TaxID=54914 RepID=UPI001F6177EF|nr:hypothetical protein [Brevibacillus parabrevis]
MSDRIPKKWARVLRDLHARFPGKMAHEIVTEDGVFRFNDRTDDKWIEIVEEDDGLIEIVEDSDFIEIVEG